MAFEKAPAFQFYASDFRADAKVSAMTFEEVGVYILLLTFCWTACVGIEREERYCEIAAKRLAQGSVTAGDGRMNSAEARDLVDGPGVHQHARRDHCRSACQNALVGGPRT